MNRFLGHPAPRSAGADAVDVRVSDTHDADEQAACLTDWGQCYEQMSHGSFDGHFESYRFDGIERHNTIIVELARSTGPATTAESYSFAVADLLAPTEGTGTPPNRP